MHPFIHAQRLPGTRTAIDEPRGRQTSTLEIEDSFCWDHGYHLGPCCPHCRREMEEHVPEHTERSSGHSSGQRDLEERTII